MTRGEKVIAFIERYCRVPEGALIGQPIKLEKFQKDFLLAVYDNSHGTHTGILSIARKNGKALSLDTPIPTPSGWTTMGELREGDILYDETGNHTKVTFTTPIQYQRDCYLVRFSDGTSIKADADHQWYVESREKGGEVLTTAAMVGNYLRGSAKREYRYRVPVNKAIRGSVQDLLVPPYLLGVWLADGGANKASVWFSDDDAVTIIGNIQKLGVPIKKVATKFEWSITDGVRNRAKPCVLKDLRTLGVLGNKHIPMQYLRADEASRWELLRGLMDCDGSVTVRGQCEYTSVSKALGYSVLELIRSLGIKASIRKCDAKLKGKVVSDNYRISFFCTKSESCFTLPRKTERLKDTLTNRCRFKSVTEITPIVSEPVRCIQVDSPNSLFLAGDGFTPTHNTAIIAAMLLAHLVGSEAVQNSQIVSGAMSRDQAAIVFNLAVKMIGLNPDLQPLVHIVPSTKKLIGLAKNVEYRALSADGKTTHGLSPVLAILDEVGQVRGSTSDFIDAIVTSQGAHSNPMLLTISTQAPTDADLLSVWIDDAKRSKDPRIVCHVYAAPDTAAMDDETAWAAANPALGKFRSVEDMRKMAEKAKRMPSFENTFRNLNLNQRVSIFSPFVSRNVWNSCYADFGIPPMSECDDVWAGLDLSARTDLTSCVFVGKKGDKAFIYPYTWTPEQGLEERARRDRAPYDVWVKQGHLLTTPGATVDYKFVASTIAELTADVNLRTIAFDRWRIDVFKKDCEELGISLPLQPFGQGFKDMSPALDSLEAELLNTRIHHDANPVLTMCMANCVVTKDPAGGRKLDKSKSTARIDTAVALTMAIGVADMKYEKPVEYGVYFI